MPPTHPAAARFGLWGLAATSVLSFVGAACDAPPTGATTAPTIDVPSTVGLTELPEPLSLVPTTPPAATVEPVDPTTSTSTRPTSTTEPVRLTAGDIADTVSGNRVLMIGDSIIASTAPRYGGPMCPTLESYGWSVRIEAEPNRFVDFADLVLDELLPEDADDSDPVFDVVMVMLGNNYGGDLDEFEEYYDEMLERLSPRPVVIYTLSEDEPDKEDLNEFIRSRPDEFDNVLVIDWAQKTAVEPERLLGSDDLHLTSLGRDRLALFSVAALGQIDVGEPDCVTPTFDADGS